MEFTYRNDDPGPIPGCNSGRREPAHVRTRNDLDTFDGVAAKFVGQAGQADARYFKFVMRPSRSCPADADASRTFYATARSHLKSEKPGW